MKKFTTWFGVLLLMLSSCLAATAQPAGEASAGPITATTAVPGHPRLLLLKGEEAAVQKTLAADATWGKIHAALLAECDRLLNAPVQQRVLIGKRLLDVSRECLRREFYLAYAWRLTRQEKYRARAEQELLAVAAFSDWNPSHFLDVAEMTTGMALGYDWLYDDLPAASRAIIREAILKKGLEPSLDPKTNDWLRRSNNWNQVCNAGMSFGALAIYEDQPVLARSILNRAVASLPLAMQAYGPDGAYPEGYGYWSYGTSFNVLLLSALDKAFGQDFGLAAQPGFLKSPYYFQHMAGPTGKSFNYSDSGDGTGTQPLLFWFADKLKDPSLLFVERQRLLTQDPNKLVKNRMLPTLLISGGPGSAGASPPPAALQWTGGGPNPVALMRTSWTDPNAIFVGMKGGSPNVSHGHMDVGSFVLDADGVRWGMDFGAQEYESLESKGVRLWDMGQDAQRWQVFRYGNQAHNTLTVNNQLQKADGYAPLTSHSAAPDFLSATTDLTKLYPGTLAAAQRGIAIVDKRYVLVRDELTAGPAGPATVRWSLLTPAAVKLTGARTAELTKDGKTLRLEVAEPATITLKTYSTQGPHDYDAPNPGTTLVGFEVTLPAGATSPLTVLLRPGSTGLQAPRKVLPLAQWPQAATPAPARP